MKIINSWNVYNARNLEYYAFIGDVLTSAKDEDTEALGITTAVNNLEKAHNELNEALVPISSAEETKRLRLLDEERDKAFKSLVKMIDVYINFPDINKATTAHELYVEVDKYGRYLYDLPYQEETGAILNLVEDLSNETNAPKVAELGLTEWVTILSQSNTKFNELFLQRAKEVEQEGHSKVKEKRDATQEQFIALCEVINARAYLEGVELYQNLADAINGLVHQVQVDVKHRGPHDNNGPNSNDNK